MIGHSLERLAPLRQYQQQWGRDAKEAREAGAAEWAPRSAAFKVRNWNEEIPAPQAPSSSSGSSSRSNGNEASSSRSNGGSGSSSRGSGNEASSSGSSGARGRNGSSKIDWDQWRPWFRPDCSLCRKEVEELIQQRQQWLQQQQQEGGVHCKVSQPPPSAAAGAEVPVVEPGALPWDWQHHQQQQQQQGASATAATPPDGEGGAGGGATSNTPPLHGSCYGAWPVPWDCPFKFRRLMWRLMGRVKPTALRFWADVVGFCAHCPDEKNWQSFVSGSLQGETLYLRRLLFVLLTIIFIGAKTLYQ